MIEVALGAGLGASVRYLMTQVLKSRTRVFPWATFIINITGALLLGFLHSKITSSHILLLLGTGFLGGSLVNNRKQKMMLIYLLLTVICGILAAYCGSWLGKL